jgi:hypothetical protein
MPRRSGVYTGASHDSVTSPSINQLDRCGFTIYGGPSLRSNAKEVSFYPLENNLLVTLNMRTYFLPT